MDIGMIAKVAHETNRAYCEALGDTSQVAWEDAPDWQRESAINGVRLHIDNPDATPEDSHDNWCQEKLDQGWRHGPVKDADKKTHPCLMGYDSLPEAQRAKDHIFRAICRQLAPFIDVAQNA